MAWNPEIDKRRLLRRLWDWTAMWFPRVGYRAQYRQLARHEEYWRLAARWGWAAVARHNRLLRPAVRGRVKRTVSRSVTG